jgi:hypothetical protein
LPQYIQREVRGLEATACLLEANTRFLEVMKGVTRGSVCRSGMK